MESRDLESDIIDLARYSLDDLRARGTEDFGASLGRLLEQVYVLRPNFSGNGGAPGRAD
jgi:hypothetical protein